MLFEDKLVFSPAQWDKGSERVKQQINCNKQLGFLMLNIFTLSRVQKLGNLDWSVQISFLNLSNHTSRLR